jgi:chemotaxis protein MotB
MIERPNTPRPIIIKKIIQNSHGGHHGGAWKVAYADFVTAMMAFFLLMWLLGATTEKQRKALADYFSPTLIEKKQESAGSNGMFGGASMVDADNYPHRAAQTGTRSLTIPRDAKGGPKETNSRADDEARFASMRQLLQHRLNNSPTMRRYARSIRLTETTDGLRIDLVDDADFAMFLVGTDRLTAEATNLMGVIALVINEVPNALVVRGHTDASPYTLNPTLSNWTLSTARAESTRRALALHGVDPRRFSRIEGVADREPYNPLDRYDSRNRRMSVTLGWSTAFVEKNETVQNRTNDNAGHR